MSGDNSCCNPRPQNEHEAHNATEHSITVNRTFISKLFSLSESDRPFKSWFFLIHIATQSGCLRFVTSILYILVNLFIENASFGPICHLKSMPSRFIPTPYKDSCCSFYLVIVWCCLRALPCQCAIFNLVYLKTSTKSPTDFGRGEIRWFGLNISCLASHNW